MALFSAWGRAIRKAIPRRSLHTAPKSHAFATPEAIYQSLNGTPYWAFSPTVEMQAMPLLMPGLPVTLGIALPTLMQNFDSTSAPPTVPLPASGSVNSTAGRASLAPTPEK